MKRSTVWRKRMLGITGLVGVGALAVAGCSSTSSTSSTSSPAAPAKVPLVVYSAQGYDKAMAAAFQKATGIPVKLDDNSTGPLLTQIEASKNNPNWGLLWVDGATAFAGPRPAGPAAQGLRAERVRGTASAAQIIPPDKSYVPTGVTLWPAPWSTTRPRCQPARPPGRQLTAAAVEGRGRNERPDPVRPDLPVHRRHDEPPRRRLRGREVLHQAEGQRADHPPDQRADAAGAHQRPDQARARPELGRRSARRSATRSLIVKYLDPVTVLPERHRHRHQGARG